jgi:hypothetical protein
MAVAGFSGDHQIGCLGDNLLHAGAYNGMIIGNNNFYHANPPHADDLMIQKRI